MAGIGNLLGGVAAGGIAGMAAKDAKQKRADRKARLDAADERASARALPAADAANRAGLEAGDDMTESVATPAGPDEHDVRLADGGEVEDKSKRRKKLDEDIDKASAYADGGEIGDEKRESAAHEARPGDAYEDAREGEPKDEKRTLKNINGRNAPASQRHGGKRPPVSPMIGVRADLQRDVGVGHNDKLAQAGADNTVGLADGGAILGYATGGFLNGNNLPGGYTQHGSLTQTADPLWYKPCVRDYGKKG